MGSIDKPGSDPSEPIQTTSVSWRLLTPGSSPGAVAIFAFSGNIPSLLKILALPEMKPGSLRIASVCGVDQGLLAYIHPGLLYIMPHGGLAIVRALEQAFNSRGLRHEPQLDSTQLQVSRHSQETSYNAPDPAARSHIEAMALDTLAFAASPMAIDLLLSQHDRWQADQSSTSPRNRDSTTHRDAILRRVITPPLVAAYGPANVGKSTLINALARRQVSIVADVPGTTRDHVGACLELDGLVVRYLDTPGMRTTTDHIEARSQEVALAAMQSADLLLHIGDASSPPPPLPESLATVPRICIHLRSDRGLGTFAHDLALRDLHTSTTASNRTPDSNVDVQLSSLASRIRESLVPRAMYDSPEPWRFWA